MSDREPSAKADVTRAKAYWKKQERRSWAEFLFGLGGAKLPTPVTRIPSSEALDEDQKNAH